MLVVGQKYYALGWAGVSAVVKEIRVIGGVETVRFATFERNIRTGFGALPVSEFNRFYV